MSERPHKFISTDIGSRNYSGVIFCEYCGQVAFYANACSNEQIEYQKESRAPCPNGPLVPTQTVKE